MKETLKNIFLLIRIKHWVKNAGVFFPAFFAARADVLFSAELIPLFFSFCLGASSIYIINDIMDIDKDKLHPTKCKRPLASGFFSIRTAIVILTFTILLLILLLVTLKDSYQYVLGYFVLNLAYSFKLKEISIIDVSCISLGFILRVLAGGSEAGLFVSHWLVIIVFLLAISLAFAKRRDDLVLKLGVEKQKLRKSLFGYSVEFLDTAKSIALSITLVAYIMYSISPEVIERIGSDKVYTTGLFAFLGIMRYLQITIVEKSSGSPTDILWKDRFIQITLVLWLSSFTILLYGKDL